MSVLYVDTSSLAKLYVEEAGASVVQQAVKETGTVCISWVGYAEMRSVFARRKREGSLTAAQSRALKKVFEADWKSLLKMQVTRELVVEAGELSEKHSLRSLDAIHLASALALRTKTQDPVIFLTADRNLQAAARREKFRTIP